MHHKLVWFAANLAARRLGYNSSDDLIASCWLAFVNCLPSYDEDRAEFSTYYVPSAVESSSRFLKSDSQWRSLRKSNVLDADERTRKMVAAYTHPAPARSVRFYHPPDNDADWVKEIIDLFGGDTAALFAALTRDLTPRRKEVVMLLFADGYTVREAAARMGLSSQRVSQIWGDCLDRMRRTVAKLDAVRRLFGGEVEFPEARRGKGQHTYNHYRKKGRDK
jgi:RNA polymerase sigma factor (sigma-70 family)